MECVLLTRDVLDLGRSNSMYLWVIWLCLKINWNFPDMTESVLLNRVVLHLGISKNISCCKVFYMVTNGTMGSIKPRFRETWFKRESLYKGHTICYYIQVWSKYSQFQITEPFICSKCDNKFKLLGHVKEYQRITLIKNHSAAQPATRNFPVGDMKEHQRTHYAKEPFSCSRCNKKFTLQLLRIWQEICNL